jgi:hypothetical protein
MRQLLPKLNWNLSNPGICHLNAGGRPVNDAYALKNEYNTGCLHLFFATIIEFLTVGNF